MFLILISEEMEMGLFLNISRILHTRNLLHNLLIKKELGILRVLIFILDFRSLQIIYRRQELNMMKNLLILKKLKAIKLVIWISILMGKTIMIALTKTNLQGKMDKKGSQ